MPNMLDVIIGAGAGLLPVLAVVMFVVVIVAARRRLALQQQRLAELAVEHGLLHHPGEERAPGIGFQLMQRGRNRCLCDRMWPPGGHDSVFRYRFVTGSGKNRTTHHYLAASVVLPFAAPHLVVSRETWWSAAKRAIGQRDIEVESPEFNDLYHVRCDDERFAITLLDQEMIAWMLSPHSGRGGVTFEFLGSWMLCYVPRDDIESMPHFLVWAQSVRRQLPDVLVEWYGDRREEV